MAGGDVCVSRRVVRARPGPNAPVPSDDPAQLDCGHVRGVAEKQNPALPPHRCFGNKFNLHCNVGGKADLNFSGLFSIKASHSSFETEKALYPLSFHGSTWMGRFQTFSCASPACRERPERLY